MRLGGAARLSLVLDQCVEGFIVTFLRFTAAQLPEKFDIEVLNLVGALTIVTIKHYVYNIPRIEHILGEAHLTAGFRTAEKHKSSHFGEYLESVILWLYL